MSDFEVDEHGKRVPSGEPVTVDIVDVFTDAFKIKAEELDPNLHGLFGAHGQRYPLSEVALMKKYVKSVTTHGWADFWDYGQDITVWPLTPPV